VIVVYSLDPSSLLLTGGGGGATVIARIIARRRVSAATRSVAIVRTSVGVLVIIRAIRVTVMVCATASLGFATSAPVVALRVRAKGTTLVGGHFSINKQRLSLGLGARVP
jgi:hypothetical protein